MFNQNVLKNLAVKGYDVVAYFDDQPTPGDPAINSESEGVLYYFANEDNKARFDASPTHFLPAFGGWCAYAMSEGKYFDIDPTSFKVSNGHLYLFYNGVGGDTKAIWDSDEAGCERKADQNWRNGSSE